MEAITSNTSRVYIEEDRVRKVIFWYHRRAYLNYTYCFNHCDREKILLPTSVTLHEDSLEVLMPKGESLASLGLIDFDKFLIEALESICELDSKGVLHADVKPENFVLHDGRFKLIDFDLLVSKEDRTTPTQTHYDVQGYAVRQGIQVEGYDNIHEAFYAFCYTCYCVLHSEPEPIFSGIDYKEKDSDHPNRLTVDSVAKSIHDDYAAWICLTIPEKHRLLFAGFLGENKYESFSHALSLLRETSAEKSDLCVWSRVLYERGCAKGMSVRDMYISFDNFYNHIHFARADQIDEYVDACFYHFTYDFSSAYAQRMIQSDKCSFVAKQIPEYATHYFLYEYASPGTWMNKMFDLQSIILQISRNPPPYVYVDGRPRKVAELA